IDSQYFISCLQSYALGHFMGHNSMLDLARRQVGLSVFQSEHPENGNSQNHIYKDAGQHDNQPLSGGFGTKFPRLWTFGDLLGVNRLVDHACNLYVSAQGKPSNAVFRVSFPELEQLDAPGIEKEIEFFNFDPKSTGGHIMSRFVQDNQYRKGRNHLGRHY